MMQPGRIGPFQSHVGEIADVGLYARDVVKFGRKFMKLAGLRRAEPRALPGQAHASQLRSLEERT